MKYALLIYGEEKLDEEATPEQWQQVAEAHNAFAAEAHERGMKPSGQALQPTRAARTVSFEERNPVEVTDGPFAETKEQLGGFYVLDCDSMDEALEMARKLPVWMGSVEVRPVMTFEQ